MQEYFGYAKEYGITNEEIGTVQTIAMAVSGGRVRAQFLDARVKARNQRTQMDEGDNK